MRWGRWLRLSWGCLELSVLSDVLCRRTIVDEAGIDEPMLVWSLARRRDQIYRAVVGISLAAVPLKIEMHPLKDERSDRDAVAHDDEILHRVVPVRSEEHTSELQTLMRISYALLCL